MKVSFIKKYVYKFAVSFKFLIGTNLFGEEWGGTLDNNNIDEKKKHNL